MNQKEKSQSIRTLNLLTLAFAVSPLIYYLIASLIIIEPKFDNFTKMIRTIFIVSAILNAIVAFFLSHFTSTRLIKIHIYNPHSKPNTSFSLIIISMALAELIAIYGFIFFIISGSRELLNICVPISIIIVLTIRSRIQVQTLPSPIPKYAFEEQDKTSN